MRVLKLLCPLLAGIALALPAAGSAAAPCANADIVPSSANIRTVEKATLCLLNAERTSRGRSRLRSNRDLGKAARSFSAAMVRQGFFDHVSPSGSTVGSRVRRGTRYLKGSVRSWSLGDTIGWGFGELATPKEIVRAWMNSSTHRRNILDRRFRDVGIGVVSGAPYDVEGVPAATYTAAFGFRVAR